ncbi:hypothetical protein BH23ACT11_BH23ACT11_04380 [soil metagenome]
MLFRALLSPVALVILVMASTSTVSAQDAPQPAGEPTLLIADDSRAFSRPVWSPDGERIAFTTAGYEGLWTSRSSGDGIVQITDEPSAGFGFTWSTDGQELLTRVTRTEGLSRSHAVKVFDVNTGEARELTEYRSRMPAVPQWTADGTAIVLPISDAVEVLEQQRPESGRSAMESSVYLGGENGMELIRLYNGVPETRRLLEGLRVLNAVISPDGSRVAFEVMGGDMYVMNQDGSAVTSLGVGYRASWSPDSQWIAFMRTEDNGKQITSSDLYAARADGGIIVPLTQTTHRLEMNPSWSPDGASIVFDDLTDGVIYVLPLTR